MKLQDIKKVYNPRILMARFHQTGKNRRKASDYAWKELHLEYQRNILKLFFNQK